MEVAKFVKHLESQLGSDEIMYVFAIPHGALSLCVIMGGVPPGARVRPLGSLKTAAGPAAGAHLMWSDALSLGTFLNIWEHLYAPAPPH